MFDEDYGDVPGVLLLMVSLEQTGGGVWKLKSRGVWRCPTPSLLLLPHTFIRAVQRVGQLRHREIQTALRLSHL